MRRWEGKRKEYREYRRWKVQDRYWIEEEGKLWIEGVIEKRRLGMEARLGGVHKLGCGEGMAGSNVEGIGGEGRVG